MNPQGSVFVDQYGDEYDDITDGYAEIGAEDPHVEVGMEDDDFEFGDDYGDGSVDEEMREIVEGDNSFGEDDEGAIEFLEGEYGRVKNPKRRKRIRKRLGKRRARLDKRARKRLGPEPSRSRKPPEPKMVPATVIIKHTLTSTGAFDVTKQVPHDFIIERAVADAPTGVTFTSLKSGDQLPMADTPEGLPASLLTPTSTTTWVNSGKISKNDIVRLQGNSASASSGDVRLILNGKKPANPCG